MLFLYLCVRVRLQLLLYRLTYTGVLQVTYTAYYRCRTEPGPGTRVARRDATRLLHTLPTAGSVIQPCTGTLSATRCAHSLREPAQTALACFSSPLHAPRRALWSALAILAASSAACWCSASSRMPGSEPRSRRSGGACTWAACACWTCAC